MHFTRDYRENKPKLSRWRYFLPMLIEKITGRERYLPDIDFSKGGVVHHIFRAWELVVFRPFEKNGYGDTIRKEASVSVQQDEHENIKIKREFYTLEASCAEIERLIIASWKRLWQVDPTLGFAPQPVFMTLMFIGLKLNISGNLYGIFAPMFGLSIGFGGSNIDNHLGGGNATVPITVSGSNTLGILHISNQTIASTTTSTWNGSNMTFNQGEMTFVTNTYIRQAYILGPTTGNVVAVRGSGTNRISAVAAYYTGVRQTSQPDNEASGTGTSTTVTGTVTNTAANCLGIMSVGEAGGALAASTNSTLVNVLTDADSGLFDSTGTPTVPTGSFSMVCTKNSGNWAQIIATFAPVISAVFTKNININQASKRASYY